MNRVSRLLGAFGRAWKEFPVTTGIICVAVVLQLLVQGYQFRFPDKKREARHVFGASVHREVRMTFSTQGSSTAELKGPFNLWDGQWWRVPVSAFHHGGWIHLALNCLGIAILGAWLEARLGWLKYLAFFLLAIMVSSVGEFLLENSAIGLSGALYAQFGALLILRRRDAEIAEMFNDLVVITGILWIFICLPLTYFDIVRIANVAHFSGLAYGWIAGQALWGTIRWRKALLVGFCVSHVLLIPAFYFVMHPFWIGRYQWYLAVHEPPSQVENRIRDLRNAVDLDPGLSQAWFRLAALYAIRGQHDQAWKTCLDGLSYNRSNEMLVRLSREIWNQFRSLDAQQNAQKVLKEIFDDEAVAWEERLGTRPGHRAGARLRLADGKNFGVWLVPNPNIDQKQQQQKIELPASLDGSHKESPTPRNTLPNVNPNDPTSAAEGTST